MNNESDKKDISFENSFLQILIDDILVAAERLEKENLDTHKRELIRTIFAGIEGNIWYYQERIKKLASDIEILDSTTLLALEQKQCHVANDGSYSTKNVYISTKTMFRFVYKIAKEINKDLDIDFGNGGWEKLNKAYEIRNRITHPKTIDDLSISRQDVEIVLSGSVWLIAAIGYSLELSYNYTQKLKDVAQKLLDGDSEFLALYELAKESD